MKLVDADELIKHLEDCAKAYIPCQNEYEVGQADTYTAIADYVSDLEPAKPKDGESKDHAHWDGMICSNCLDEAPAIVNGGYYESNYCPNCGAKMDEEEKE